MTCDVKTGQKPESAVNFVMVGDQKPQHQPKKGFSAIALEPIEIDFVTRRV